MFNWFRKIKARLKPRALRSETNALLEPQRPDKASLKVMLWSPEYDEATGIMGKWLDRMPVPVGVRTYCAIGKDVTRGRFEETLAEADGMPHVQIFAGHGSPNALLGPIYDQCNRVVVDECEFAALYDDESPRDGPAALFAFCCKSAQKLGPLFASSEGNSFLGYTENIGYDLDNEECQDVWKKIVYLITADIIKEGQITKRHNDVLLSLYDDAISYFRDGPGKGNDRDLETIIMLMKHKKFLKRIGGTA